MNAKSLGQIVHTFFADHLAVEKGLKPTTIQSYRDVMKLFLRFAGEHHRRKICNLKLDDLSLDLVQTFLNYLEQSRGNHTRTRNHRLAVLHTFFEFLARRHPEFLGVCQQIAQVPNKRSASPPTHYLLAEQIQMLFHNVSQSARHGLRDRALLMFLYNTGARVSEAAKLKINQLDLSGPCQVRLYGKGGKWRTCPLWKETTRLLHQLLDGRDDVDSNAPVFRSDRGSALTRFGIYKIVRRHCQRLEEEGIKPADGHISPHTLRHTAAVHLLESGVEVNVIRAWLGHVKLETTNRYAEITLRTKEAALRECQVDLPQSSARPRTRWRDDEELLKWLDSL